MSSLLRATTLIGQPVVTLAGDSPLEVKDVVFDTSSGQILGFTLRKKGFFGKPVGDYLSWANVHGLGPDAVTIGDEDVLTTDVDGQAKSGGNVIGNRILTESGTDLGEVVEVVVSTGRQADVVGFEVTPVADDHNAGDHNVFIPRPDTLAISGEKIMVPDEALDYIRDDLSGFGSAVAKFRTAHSGKDK